MAFGAIASVLGSAFNVFSSWKQAKAQKKAQRRQQKQLEKEKKNQENRQKAVSEEQKKRVNLTYTGGRKSLLSKGFKGLGLSGK